MVVSSARPSNLFWTHAEMAAKCRSKSRLVAVSDCLPDIDNWNACGTEQLQSVLHPTSDTEIEYCLAKRRFKISLKSGLSHASGSCHLTNGRRRGKLARQKIACGDQTSKLARGEIILSGFSHVIELCDGLAERLQCRVPPQTRAPRVHASDC